MSVSFHLQHDGELCDVRACSSLVVAVCDVPRDDNTTVAVAICLDHYRELHAADDPIQTAREWVR